MRRLRKAQKAIADPRVRPVGEFQRGKYHGWRFELRPSMPTTPSALNASTTRVKLALRSGWTATDMTSPPTPPLTDIERDALAELSNIAMARAATSLRQMVENQVLLSVPSVDIVSKEEATRLVANPNNPKLVAVRQDFKGPFSGRALLIFPEANSLELVRVVVGKELPLKISAISKTKRWQKPATSF